MENNELDIRLDNIFFDTSVIGVESVTSLIEYLTGVPYNKQARYAFLLGLGLLIGICAKEVYFAETPSPVPPVVLFLLGMQLGSSWNLTRRNHCSGGMNPFRAMAVMRIVRLMMVVLVVFTIARFLMGQSQLSLAVGWSITTFAWYAVACTPAPPRVRKAVLV